MELSQPTRIGLWCALFVMMFVLGLAVQVALPIGIGSTYRLKLQQVHRKSPNVAVTIRTIPTPTEWGWTIQSGRYVVFVDCTWNMYVALFRPQFEQFAGWCLQNTEYVPIRVELHDVAHDPMWELVNKLCSTHAIPDGGMKFQGGGVIVWLEDGEVVDFAHCAGDGEFYPDGFAALKARTQKLDHSPHAIPPHPVR